MSRLQRPPMFENQETTAPAGDALSGLGRFKPSSENQRGRLPEKALKKFSETQGFPSREPRGQKKKKRAAARRALPQTGRNEQFNIKVHPAAKQAFYDIADAQKWGLGETLEHALEALKERLAAQEVGRQ